MKLIARCIDFLCSLILSLLGAIVLVAGCVCVAVAFVLFPR